MKFISVQLNQLDEYHHLITEAYASTLALGINFKAATVSKDEVIQHLRSTSVFGIEEANRLISTLSIRFPWSHNASPYYLPHLGWLATATDFKHQGLSQTLYHWVEKTVLIEGLKAPAVTLGTALNPPWLIEFYKKLGFIEFESTELGRGHTTVYMKKILSQ